MQKHILCVKAQRLQKIYIDKLEPIRKHIKMSEDKEPKRERETRDMRPISPTNIRLSPPLTSSKERLQTLCLPALVSLSRDSPLILSLSLSVRMTFFSRLRFYNHDPVKKRKEGSPPRLFLRSFLSFSSIRGGLILRSTSPPGFSVCVCRSLARHSVSHGARVRRKKVTLFQC